MVRGNPATVMRILHVLDHSVPLHSGYSFRTLSILREQRALGWDVDCLTTPKHTTPYAPCEAVDGFVFHRTPAAQGFLAALPVAGEIALIAATARALDAMIRANRPDILHAHSPALTGVAALRAGRRHGIPVVYECRGFWEDAAVDHGTAAEWGPRYRATRMLETWVFQRANAVTTICNGLRREIAGRGIPGEKITLIPNAVDIAQFVPHAGADADLQARLGLANCTVLGFLGSFYAYEGLEFLIRSLPAIMTAAPDVKLLLVGGGPCEKTLRQAVLELGLSDRVVFAGRVPQSEVGRYYSLVDLLVFPRLPMRLTELVTPLKPLEAMAQKKLVLASDVGGHKELIVHGQTGYLFRQNDSADLAGCIAHILAAREETASVREQGRRFVESERNWKVSVANYVNVYEVLLSR